MQAFQYSTSKCSEKVRVDRKKWSNKNRRKISKGSKG